MKRQNQDNEQPKKRVRPHKKFTGRILIAGDQAAMLIGAKGATINAIRRAYENCKVDCPDSHGDFRSVQVDADDIESMANCMTEVVNRLEQSTRKKRLTLKQGWNAVNVLVSECQVSFNINFEII